MSILKVILHHWNKTTQSYDNFHPETEVSQVTDWNQGIVNTLASTALGGLVNTLTSDSLLAKMIQKVLEATGVKYSLGQNGYACFGSLVGGLIIQWGRNSENKATDFTVNLNIAMNTITAIPIDVSDSGSKTTAICVTSVEKTKLNLGSASAPYGYAWVAIGYTL